MLAYLFWHRPYSTTSVKQYEESLLRFQQHLGQQHPPRFSGSASFRVAALPWLPHHRLAVFHYHDLNDEDGMTGFELLGTSGERGARNARTASCAPYMSTSSWPASENRTNCLGSLASA